MVAISKCVVVTGGATGIGLATSLAFARKGDWVFAVDSNLDALHDLPLGIVQVHADLADPAGVTHACAEILSRTLSVDILVGTSPVVAVPKSESGVDASWDTVMNGNVRSSWLMVKRLLPTMGERSAIILVEAPLSPDNYDCEEVMTAANGALVSLSYSLAQSLSKQKIRVNSVSPGALYVPASHDEGQEEEGATPPRVGTPEDIASTITYLTNDRVDFAAGANVVMEGGVTRKMVYRD